MSCSKATGRAIYAIRKQDPCALAKLWTTLAHNVSDQPVFRLDLTVADDDIDDLGHASNIAFVRWIQRVAIAHSESVGLGLETYRRLGGVFVVARHEIDYLRPALRGDVLQARTWISTVMAAKVQRATELVRAVDGEPVARSLTSWGWVEMASGRPRRIPQEVLVAFERVVH
jgi:acyl-CoA thioester hydrolase